MLALLAVAGNRASAICYTIRHGWPLEISDLWRSRSWVSAFGIMVSGPAGHIVRIVRLGVLCSNGEECRVGDEYQTGHCAE